MKTEQQEQESTNSLIPKVEAEERESRSESEAEAEEREETAVEDCGRDKKVQLN